MKRFFKKIRSSRFRDIQESANIKVQILNEVSLIQVERKRVSFQDRKNENTPKFPSIKICMILGSILTLLKNAAEYHISMLGNFGVFSTSIQTSFQIWTFSAILYLSETTRTNFLKIPSHNLHNVCKKV